MDEPRTRHEQRSPLWRRALVLLTSAVMFAAASGQTTVTVGTGTTTTTGFPITSCYGYSYTQNLYLASEILSGGGFAGSISKIRFYYATAMATPTTSNAWTIYMGNTPNTSLAIASAIPTSSMSQVFSGTVTYPAAGNWMEITLTTPFVWNGTDNLVVAVDENAPSYSCSAGWRYTSTAATRGIRWYSDTANPDPTLLPGTYSGSTGTLAGYPNIQVDVTSLSACAGTPTPGNTTGPTGACSGISFNLGLQNATTGSGVTYQWQYDNGGGWTNFGPNLPSASTSQTVATSYRCIVTCANDPTPGMSNPLAVPMNPFYTCYCNSAFTSVTYEFITNVTYAGINNSSAGNTGGPVNYTSQVATVYTGTSNQIAVTVDPDALDYIYAFIDWDQNGILNDPGEVYTIASSINTAGPHTLNITVPGTAMTGQTRMRVMIDYNNATPNPCRNATYGEAEDYTVDVQMATCTPPVATIIRDDSNCPNFTLSADITSLGSATDVSVSYSVNGGPASSVGPFSSTGVQTIGTFGTGQSVAVTLVHDQDAQCNVALGTFSPLGLCNDFCSNATPITCAMSPVSGTSVGSTQDPIPCTLAGNTFNQLQQAVWYKYVGDDQQVTLNTCGTGTLTDSRLTVFDGTCGSLNCVAGNDDMGAACGIGTLHSQVQWNAFSGNTYYIAVHAYGATTTGTFTLNLTCTPLCLPVPVNDDCANAIPLAVGSSCSPVAGSTQCASASATANPTCISTFATAPDVFYSFTAGDVTQIASFGNITAGNLGLALYDACGGTSLYCQASSVSGQDIILPSLTIGNMYILRVFSLLTQEGGFDICLRNPCQPPSVSVTPTYSDCASATPGQTSVMVDVTAVGTDPTLDIVVNGSTVQSGVGVGSYGPYAYPSGTPVTVNVVTDDSFCDQSFGPYINTNNCVVCDGPILDYTFCYPDNMNQSWLFESDGGGGNFALHFISGTIESSSFDHLTIYDGPNNTYPVLFNHASGTTSLAGITAMATGTNIYMVATSDGSVSCGSGSFSGDPWHWQVYCLSCDLPQASVVGTDVDCLTGTYTVDVNVTSIGDAPDVDIVSDLNGLDPNGDDVGVGVHTVGPFPVGTPVNLSVVHNGNNACNITLPAVNPNSNCIACNNTPLAQTYCYGPSDAQNWSYTSDGNGTLVLSFQSGSIESSTFDHLTIYDGSSNAAPILYDHVGATENLAGLMVVATGNALYMEMDSDSSVQCSTNPAWQWNWTVQCVDCTFPQATATLLSNCGGGNFTIQVDVTNASNAGNVNITTDYIGDTEPTGVGNGTYVLGPYPLGTVVQLDVAHPTNAFCTLDLGEFTDCCNGTCGGATQAILGTNTAGKLDCGNGASNLGTDEYGASTGATNARWFYYDATQTGTLLATSCASGIDTRVKFHDGNGGCGSLVPLSANDDDCFPSSTTGYFVSPGDHVLIEWDDRWSDSGFDWDLSFAPCTPDPNLDLCSTQNPASRQVSIGSGETWTGTLDCLSADDIIPNPYSNTWGWGWAAFELTECANVRVDYCGTASFGFGSLNMYGDCGNLFINSQSYDFSTCGDGNPTIFFNNLTPGFYYYPILWSPPNNAVGPFTVNVSAFTPTVACASNLTACSATPVACNDVVTGNTDNLFPSLPANACPFPNGATSGGSLWYSYTATQDENVILSTCGAATTFDTRISVFEGPDCSTLSCYTLGDDKGGACTNRTQIEFF
ncbi:MAG: hypothetical protein KDB97_05880, partial [Flavobacteriales bacterium]|nr:hypothetical protein [Flavobacteriales bacterium]